MLLCHCLRGWGCQSSSESWRTSTTLGWNTWENTVFIISTDLLGNTGSSGCCLITAVCQIGKDFIYFFCPCHSPLMVMQHGSALCLLSEPMQPQEQQAGRSTCYVKLDNFIWSHAWSHGGYDTLIHFSPFKILLELSPFCDILSDTTIVGISLMTNVIILKL